MAKQLQKFKILCILGLTWLYALLIKQVFVQSANPLLEGLTSL